MREARSLVFGRGADQRDWVRQDPDSLLVDLVDAESTLLREVEQYRYGSVIREGFSSMDTFLHLANEITVEGEENFVGDSEIIALGGASNETKDRPLG